MKDGIQKKKISIEKAKELEQSFSNSGPESQISTGFIKKIITCYERQKYQNGLLFGVVTPECHFCPGQLGDKGWVSSSKSALIFLLLVFPMYDFT